MAQSCVSAALSKAMVCSLRSYVLNSSCLSMIAQGRSLCDHSQAETKRSIRAMLTMSIAGFVI